ncbi:Hypothetical protein EHI5A_222560 [Entamoeba histolytica KU27]|uniref:Uncharacterized protein n=1 Tax=Entamoeba histolytica KU27 TaxID=885311 RepID=M2RZM0_ENTHI|nr:Hypothetical protein EHI5A_222560 [Entamoeba histolytica KU27]
MRNDPRLDPRLNYDTRYDRLERGIQQLERPNERTPLERGASIDRPPIDTKPSLDKVSERTPQDLQSRPQVDRTQRVGLTDIRPPPLNDPRDLRDPRLMDSRFDPRYDNRYLRDPRYLSDPRYERDPFPHDNVEQGMSVDRPLIDKVPIEARGSLLDLSIMDRDTRLSMDHGINVPFGFIDRSRIERSDRIDRGDRLMDRKHSFISPPFK